MRRASIIATILITAALVAGCGGGSAGTAALTAQSTSAHKLLVETFTGAHRITSGVISFGLKVVPSGSSMLTKPIELTVGGPFSSSSAGKLPQSDFTITLSAQGRSGDLQVISAGGKGYITLAGQSFELPASSYSKLKSGLGSLSGAKSGSSSLARLGIRPLDWVKGPRIAGDATIDGDATTHIRAHVDATALLRDLSRLIRSSGSLTGASAAGALKAGISPAEQRAIASAMHSPRLDVWTGTGDQILRKLTFSATIPVTGKTSTELGGLSSVVVSFDLAYSHLNQPQTITAPSSVEPFSVFRAEVTAFLQQIQGGIGTGTTTTATTTGTTTGTTSTGVTTGTTSTGVTSSIQSSSTAITSANQRYTRCILGAKGAVSKMQRCAKLLTKS